MKSFIQGGVTKRDKGMRLSALTANEELATLVRARIPILTSMQNESIFQNSASTQFFIIKDIDRVPIAEQCRYHSLLKDRIWQNQELPKNVAVVFLANNLGKEFYSNEFLSLVTRV